jgi:ankyrin repeat protein
MHPKLLMATRLGETERMKDLLEEASSAAVPPDLALQFEASAPCAALLLEGATVQGDSALHVVAACGDGNEFLESAKMIHGKANHLLATPNKRGDMPLHCAARAGNARMVSQLITLAKVEGHGAEEKLRTVNKLGQTALHEAVRAGNEDIVIQLMAEDSELATFPKDGSSPLYLAILLEEVDIARSLHCMSRGNLSYSGPNGQNALHAAVLRGRGTIFLAICAYLLSVILLSFFLLYATFLLSSFKEKAKHRNINSDSPVFLRLTRLTRVEV